MYEKNKLKEAEYFLKRIKDSKNDPTAFGYELSAFLSAARSVLQYGLEEAKQKTSGEKWYALQMGDPVLKFFKDRRDLNIHAEPVKPSRQISISINEQICVSDSKRLEVQRENGMVETQDHKGESPQAKSKDSSTEIKIRYVFDDWQGPEDAITLSQNYMNLLKGFVKDGLNKNFISE